MNNNNFTKPAEKEWIKIPEATREKLLSNVFCTTCGEMTTIVEYEGDIRGGDIRLKGQCKTCEGDVTRIIERN